MKQYTSKDVKIVKGLPPKAKVADRIAIDLEMFGMEKKRLHRPDNGTFASLACSFDGKTVYMIFDDKEIKKFLANLDKGVWIFHNAKFDITHLRRYATIKQRTKLWDTMLIEQIMYSGLYRDFTLADVARRRLNIYLPKEQRLEFTAPDDDDESTTNKVSDSKQPDRMTQDMIEYAAYDVVATWQIFKDQRSEIDETDLSIWNNIELPFLWCLLSMSGVKLDVGKWTTLAEKNKAYADSIRKKYKEINLNSPAQVKKKLNELGYHIASTGEAVLVEIADNCKFAKDMMFFRTYAKRASTYGVKFVEDHVDKVDGRVHADIFQIGAECLPAGELVLTNHGYIPVECVWEGFEV